MTLTIEKPAESSLLGLTLFNGVVTSTSEGGPAEKGGLKVDDLVFSLNGAPVGELTAGEVTKLFQGAVGRIDVVVERMQGVGQSRADDCIDVAWDSTEKILAVAFQDVGVTIFANRTGGPLVTLLEPVARLKTEGYSNPIVQRWSASGQLVIGMADGTFCIWDYNTSKTFGTPLGGSGQHLSAIKAADWTLSKVAPALALGSVSTIKVRSSVEPTCVPNLPCTDHPRTLAQVSRGSKNGEWTCTSMKAKPVYLKNSLGGVTGTIVSSDASSSTITSPAGKRLFRSLSFSRRNSTSASETPDGPATTSPARLPSKKLGRKFSFDRLKPSRNSSSSSTTGSQKEASGELDILQLAFSQTGDHLAALVQPIAAKPSSSSQSSYEALLGIVAGHRGEVHQPVKTVESSEKYVIVYTTRGEQLEPLVMPQLKREKGAVTRHPCPLQQHYF